MNNESILTSVKRVLGIEPAVDAFDEQLILHTNTALSILAQLGVGPEDGLYISGAETTWDELIGENKLLSLVKTYVHQKVRLIFDPPLTSSVLDSIERNLKEVEWRILAVTDHPATAEENHECVDEQARADIEKHAGNDDIHHTGEDIEKMITDVKVIHGTL